MGDFLKDVDQGKEFYFRNGSRVRNVYELAQNINSLDDDTFKFHCNSEHDDFANWIGGALGDIELSKELRKIKDKKQYLKYLNTHIGRHEKETHASQLNKAFSEGFSNYMHEYGYIWLIIFIMIITSIFTAMIYFQYNSLKNIQALDEKIDYIESRNTCFNNYFNEQILVTKDIMRNATFLDNYCVYNYTTTTKIPDDVMENTPALIAPENIIIDGNRIIITLENSSLSVFADTSSMLPIINHNTKAIQIKPDVLNIGDIISYEEGEDIIIHRIVDIGTDSEGIYYITKGDNNNAVDPIKVRYDNIRGKVVVLIY
ncbi:MAG: hypothetical protein ACP5NV_03650 [Candidatus Woesearchaeota archaeon]